MSKTTLMCKCGGSLVIDLSRSLKLIAPSFSLTPDGVRNLVIDLRREKGEIAPSYYCTSCSAVYDEKTIKDCVTTCRMCQEEKPISSMFVTSYVSPICDECVEGAKSGTNSKIADVFSTPKNFRTHPLIAVLFKSPSIKEM